MSFQKDHEFPHIEVNMETREMLCTVCKLEGSTDDWISFISRHSNCQPKEKQEITTNDVDTDFLKNLGPFI